VSHLLVEMGIRLAKVVGAAILGVLIYLILTGPLAATPSLELGLLAWLSGAAVILLVESSPI
jgi:hypothetical protein